MEQGIHSSWEHHFGGVILTCLESGETVLLQAGNEAGEFLDQVKTIDRIWTEDPSNKEGRIFKSYEEHLDMLIDPYFN